MTPAAQKWLENGFTQMVRASTSKGAITILTEPNADLSTWLLAYCVEDGEALNCPLHLCTVEIVPLPPPMQILLDRRNGVFDKPVCGEQSAVTSKHTTEPTK